MATASSSPQLAEDWIARIKGLPVAAHFSQSSWQALRQYLLSGPTQQRGHRFHEFFKALDWLAYGSISPNPLKNLPTTDATRLKSEIDAYFQAKQSLRSEQRDKRASYKLKVFDYYRTHVSAPDKMLVERLREYEQDRTGQDVNWRHYFWFTSFRQIDAFCNQSSQEREATILAFHRDVTARQENAERLKNGTYGEYYWGEQTKEPLSFDEWLNQHQHDDLGTASPRPSANQTLTKLPPHLEKAYQTLNLKPLAPMSQVKQQFRHLTRQYHPDMPGGSESRMKALLAAYNTLKKIHAL